MKLVIVESPGKIKTITGCLPDGFEVLASVGHITEIPKKGLNIKIDDGTFDPIVRLAPSKSKVVSLIKNRAAQADEIFLCTDSDREGERISFDLAHIIKAPDKIRRASFQEITKKAVRNAIGNPGKIDRCMVESQVARQVLDRLIGYLVSPMLWGRIEGGKSAGRVQSVALRLIAERELEVRGFTSEDYWTIPVMFGVGNEVLEGLVKTKDKDNKILDKVEMFHLLEEVKSSTPIVTVVDKKLKSKGPYPPFDTAGLQKAASAAFGWTGKKTMDIAQKVYELGLISYHRTDSFAVSDDAYVMASRYIKEQFGDEYLPKERKLYKKKSKSQEAHECIRPTHLGEKGFFDPASLSEDQRKLYDLVVAGFVASQMEDMRYEKTVIIVQCGEVEVIVEGAIQKFDGWTRVWKVKSEDTFLPPVNKGDELKIQEVKSKEHKTKPPSRYNDRSLVSKMEKEGVGRPSTWASLVENLIKRRYIIRNGKNFELTSVGEHVFEFLMERFSGFFMDIKFTSEVEDQLDEISQGNLTRTDVVKKFYDELSKLVYKDRDRMLAGIFS